MNVKFCSRSPLPDTLIKSLSDRFGFDACLDFQDEDGCEYFIGISADDFSNEEDDPMPYEDAVRCCGFLEAQGITDYAIEGSGHWAMGMIRRKDFEGLAMTEAEKEGSRRISEIFWNEFAAAQQQKGGE